MSDILKKEKVFLNNYHQLNEFSESSESNDIPKPELNNSNDPLESNDFSEQSELNDFSEPSESNISNWNQIMQTLYNYSDGDLRKATNLMQQAVYVSNLNDESLSPSLIYEVSGQIMHTDICNIYNTITKTKDYLLINNLIIKIMLDGHTHTDIINKLSFLILNDENLSNITKANIFIKMSDTSNLLANGSELYIQLLSLFSFINQSIQNKI
jgi:hypothetical protein